MKWSDLLLCLCVLSIFFLGVVMVFGTTSAEALDMSLSQNTHRALYRHLIYGVLGILVAYVIRLIGYKALIQLGRPLFYISCVLLALVFVPFVGKITNGSYRWIGWGGFTIQPSELIKYTIILYYIVEMCQNEFSLKKLVRVLSWCAFSMLLVALEPDNGTVAIMGACIVALLFLSRVPFKYWAWPLAAFIVICGIIAVQVPYVTYRIQVYLNPQMDLLGKGHQPYQAKIATGSGQFWGKGVGNSLQKLSYLPEAQNDFIAAIYAEEFGFIGILLLVGLYVGFTYFGTKIALEASDTQGAYLAATITFLITIQAFLNLGVVSGLLPSTGLNLPFFSQGGSSLIANVVGIGLLISVSEKSTSPGHIQPNYQEELSSSAKI